MEEQKQGSIDERGVLVVAKEKGWHAEKIICPECQLIQTAIVEHTFPWWSYVHNCFGCKYVIMESEWQKL